MFGVKFIENVEVFSKQKFIESLHGHCQAIIDSNGDWTIY